MLHAQLVEHTLVFAPLLLDGDPEVEEDAVLQERFDLVARGRPVSLIISPPRPMTMGFCESRSTRIAPARLGVLCPRSNVPFCDKFLIPACRLRASR